MNHICRKIFKFVFNMSELSLNNTESFLIELSENSSSSRKEQIIREYLQNYYQKENVQKCKDFPIDSEWINTTKPLSIHRDFKGKLVLLDFFTYCCINCMHVLPDLKFLENKFSVEDGLVVVGIHSAKFTNEKESKNIESAVKRYRISHAVLNDSEGTVWDALNIHCWPTLVVIGPNGEVLLTLQGEGYLNTLISFIEVTLKFMKEQNNLSNHSLPHIGITNELQHFKLLSFPGKVTSYCSNKTRLLAISDTGHHRILILSDTGNIQHVIGGIYSGFKDGDFTTVQFNSPQGVVFKNSLVLYVADTENHAIREVSLEKKYVKTVTGTGSQGHDMIGGKLWTEQEISSPWDVCFDKNKTILFIAMAGTHQIWGLYLADEENIFKKGKRGECKVIAGSGHEENRNNFYPHSAGFAQPSGLSYCAERNSIFIADSESSCIRELNLETGKVSAVIGGSRNPLDLFTFGDRDGVGYDVRLQHVLGVAWHDAQRKLFIADSYNHKLKSVDISKQICSTIKLDTSLNEPGGLCVLDDQILIADTNNHCIKIYDTKNLIISVLSINEFVETSTESSSSVEIIKISKNGGKLNMKITLSKSNDMLITEDSPAYWLLNFVDEQSKKLPMHDIREKLKLKSDFTIDIPKYSDKSNIFIRVNGIMYVCKEAQCSMKKIFFLVNVQYNDEAATEVSCDLSQAIN